MAISRRRILGLAWRAQRQKSMQCILPPLNQLLSSLILIPDITSRCIVDVISRKVQFCLHTQIVITQKQARLEIRRFGRAIEHVI